MLYKGKPYRTIWENPGDKFEICVIDQTRLPFEFNIVKLNKIDDFINAINKMIIRGAPLIGVTAAYGLVFSILNSGTNWKNEIKKDADKLIASRPTAVNLKWAVENQLAVIDKFINKEAALNALKENARFLADEDVKQNLKIGEFGFQVIKEIYQSKQSPVNILTHCNAGWLATVDIGTATAPIYEAQKNNIPVHVWVDETRPRNQGAKLTAWEMVHQNIPHTLIADNTGGHLMQNGLVDIVIVGSDRTSSRGDVANKIGTYLKALAAFDNNIPFYVALPTSTIDLSIEDGIKEIVIEERSQDEVKSIDGFDGNGISEILIAPPESNAKNYGFDVTPARLVTGLITEKGICRADEISIRNLINYQK